MYIIKNFNDAEHFYSKKIILFYMLDAYQFQSSDCYHRKLNLILN